MKKFFVLLALIMTSCAPSNEEKAEKLIKETLKGYLYHPDSYEPISTRVDSTFIDATTIEPIMGICEEIRDLDLMSKIFKCQISMAHAETTMDLALEGYFSREDYARAKKDKEQAKSALDKYTKKLSGQIASLKENVAKYHKGEYTGWVVSYI